MTDQLSGQLQAVYTSLREEMRFLYQHNLHAVCRSLQSADTLLHTTVVSHPTSAMRALLNDSYLVASSGFKVIEVWPCSPVPRDALQVKSQQTDCTREIPVTFQYRNRTYEGYLDPVSLVISHFGSPADCFLQKFIPLIMYKRRYNYNRANGSLNRVPETKFQKLNINTNYLQDNFDDLVPAKIFKHVLMYNW